MSRCFPWSLNYASGGADYPPLFQRRVEVGADADAEEDMEQPWRRKHGEALLRPGPYAQMLACRPEMQIAGDWMLVPAARNLHWRYEVLSSAFIACKQRLNPDSNPQQNMDDLVKAIVYIWERMAKNNVCIQGKVQPINGKVELLFKDDNISSLGKLIMKSYLDTTRHISGCQAIRKKIGHILFGFRVVFGECLFITVSPNRRHSSLLLRLSRARGHDTLLRRTDATSKFRKQYHGSDLPKFMSSTACHNDVDGQAVAAEIPLPPLLARQAWIAQDPLASVHHYQVIMYVVLPAAFGVRMCLHCPWCNPDTGVDYVKGVRGCSDMLGCNHKLVGGFAGIACAMAFANEFQGEGTNHGHGFVAMSNMYQHSTLHDIAAMLEENARQMPADELVKRVKDYCAHVQRQSHMDPSSHEKNFSKMEEGFNTANDEALAPENVHLAARPKDIFNSQEMDTDSFRDLALADAQFVMSRVQHHWHKRMDNGEWKPLPYCSHKHGKTKKDSVCCKQGFPHVVLMPKERQKTRVVCRGMAVELRLKTSGRRNMLGSILGARSDPWFASTSMVLSVITRSNSNVQISYRLPLTPATHEADCRSKNCLQFRNTKAIFRISQRAMKQMAGYFGGYISKSQKLGSYELKKSIAALPLLQEKVNSREVKSASAQLAHIVNRMFTVLESKGILRTATEEFALSALYNAKENPFAPSHLQDHWEI